MIIPFGWIAPRSLAPLLLGAIHLPRVTSCSWETLSSSNWLPTVHREYVHTDSAPNRFLTMAPTTTASKRMKSSNTELPSRSPGWTSDIQRPLRKGRTHLEVAKGSKIAHKQCFCLIVDGVSGLYLKLKARLCCRVFFKTYVRCETIRFFSCLWFWAVQGPLPPHIAGTTIQEKTTTSSQWIGLLGKILPGNHGLDHQIPSVYRFYRGFRSNFPSFVTITNPHL